MMYSTTHVVGGQSIPKFDYDLAEGVRKTFAHRYTDNLVRGFIFEEPDVETEHVKEVLLKIQDNIGLHPSLSNYEKYKDKELMELAINYKELTGNDTLPRMDFFETLQKKAYDLSYKETNRATYQAMEALIHNLNTMSSRAGAQVDFDLT